MANFVERATLIVSDQSSASINKINKSLSELFRTANKLSSIRINLRGLDRIQSQVNNLTAKLKQTERVPLKIQLTGLRESDVSKVKKLTAALRDYRKVAAGLPGVNIPAPNVPAPPPQPRQPRQPRPVAPPPGLVQRQLVNINVRPLENVLNGFVARLGSTIESAIISGFKRGTSDIDVAETRLALQNVTPQERGLATQVARAISEQFPTVSRGAALGLVSELFPVVRGQNEAIQPIANQLAQFAQLRVALGESAEQAINSSIELAKAGEQMGAFTDATGKVDIAGVEKFFATINRAFALIGKEATPELVRGLTKSLRTSKFGLDERGLLTALFLAEESGTTAGVGINQAIKQLSGERVQKKQLARLMELGLITSKEVEAGKVGNQTVTELVGGGAIDEAQLRSNILQWVVDNVIPKARDAGFDVSNPVEAARFAGEITSDRTATEALTSLLIRANELQSQVDRALGLDVSPERLQGVTDASLLVSLSAASEQFTSVLGEVGNSLSGVLIPAANGAASVLQQIASFIAGPDGEGSATRSAAAAAGAGALAFGALKGGGALLNFFNPLNASAGLLSKAAAELSAAAAAIRMANGLSAGNGLGGMPGDGPGGKPGRQGLAPRGFLMSLIGGGILTALTVQSMDVQAVDLRGMTPEQKTKAIADAKARGDAQERSLNLQIEGMLKSVFGETFTNMLVKTVAEQDAEKKSAVERAAPEMQAAAITDLKSQIANLTAQIATQRAEEKIPGTADFAVQGLEQQRAVLEGQLVTMSADLAAADAGFAATFATGSQQAGTAVSTGLTGGAQTAAPWLTQAIVAGGQQAAAALSAAISNAAANVRINVNQQAAASPNVGARNPVE